MGFPMSAAMTAEAGRPALDPPHIHSGRPQRRMAWAAVAALAPAAAWGIAGYGYRAALVVAIAVLTAVASEAAVGLLRRRTTVLDGTAALTGLIVGMALPPGAPLAVPAVASAFAVLAVKAPAGGLGANWANPAMGGIAFAYASFGRVLSAYALPATVRGADALSSATPLRGLADSGAAHGAFAVTGFDSDATKLLNDVLFRPLGAPMSEGYIDLVLGNRPGAIGEASIVLLAIGAVVLIAARVIRWEIPLAGCLALAALEWTLGGLPRGSGLFSGDALLALAGGSACIALFICATDPVTSPRTWRSRVAYGVFLGALIFLLRISGKGGDGTAFAVLMANALAAAIERAPGRGKAREAR